MENGDHMLKISDLAEYLEYHQKTGMFFWKKVPPKSSRAKVGGRAGSSDGRYRYITLKGIRFSEHRAAIAITLGRWPTSQNIDHIDGNGINNKLSNLREVTISENQQNQRRPQKSNSTGFLGVVPVLSRKSPKKYRAQIWVSGKPKNLGYFETPEQANKIYLREKRKLHSGCTI